MTRGYARIGKSDCELPVYYIRQEKTVDCVVVLPHKVIASLRGGNMSLDTDWDDGAAIEQDNSSEGSGFDNDGGYGD